MLVLTAHQQGYILVPVHSFLGVPVDNVIVGL